MSNLLSTIISSGYQTISAGRYSIFKNINPDALTRCVRTEKIDKPTPYTKITGGLSNIAGHYNTTVSSGCNSLFSKNNYSIAVGLNSTAIGYNSILK